MVKKARALQAPRLQSPLGSDSLAPAIDLDGSMLLGEAVLAHRLGRAVVGIPMERG